MLAKNQCKPSPVYSRNIIAPVRSVQHSSGNISTIWRPTLYPTYRCDKKAFVKYMFMLLITIAVKTPCILTDAPASSRMRFIPHL